MGHGQSCGRDVGMSADTHVATSGGGGKNNLENNNIYAITSKSTRTAVGTSEGYLISRAAIYNAAQSGRQAKQKKQSTLLARKFCEMHFAAKA